VTDHRDDVKAVKAACPHCKTEAEYLIDAEAYERYVAMKRQFPDIEVEAQHQTECAQCGQLFIISIE
jgi:hypothetical protein